MRHRYKDDLASRFPGRLLALPDTIRPRAARAIAALGSEFVRYGEIVTESVPGQMSLFSSEAGRKAAAEADDWMFAKYVQAVDNILREAEAEAEGLK